jgi:hypothetical protein
VLVLIHNRVQGSDWSMVTPMTDTSLCPTAMASAAIGVAAGHYGEIYCHPRTNQIALGDA